ncbi:MAG: carboxymuconolactone decarboxylase family protein [Acidimicrobiales bacterium]
MPRIQPIPLDELAPKTRQIIEEGVADGTYATPIPLQIFAYRTQQILMTHAARGAWGQQSLLGGRILELIRIRSAQLGECQPCMQSRKHDSITDEDVACLVAPGGSDLTEQERLAVQFLDLLSADHHAIDDEFYRELGRVFTAAQIIELGFTCANSMGLHRFIHTLDVFGTEEPVIAYDPSQVDAAFETDTEQTRA